MNEKVEIYKSGFKYAIIKDDKELVGIVDVTDNKVTKIEKISRFYFSNGEIYEHLDSVQE